VYQVVIENIFTNTELILRFIPQPFICSLLPQNLSSWRACDARMRRRRRRRRLRALFILAGLKTISS
jgi:hypothetical protein